MLANHIDSFKILEFFPYPSFVQFEISSYEFHEKRGDKQIMKLFESVLKRANEITGKSLGDNKIAFKIFHIPTETTLYIGYKDGKYTLGMDVWSEVPSKKRIIEELESHLRPLSSMTEEEMKELKTLFDAEEVTNESICYLEGGTLEEYLSHISYSFCSKIIDWLDKHHFNYKNNK